MVESPNVFEFSNLSFTVADKDGDGRKALIKNVSATLDQGRVLAILGPSGAGKTTLINALTLNEVGGEVTGAVCLNGEPLTRQYFQDHAYVVPQRDLHWSMLTCRETLTYAARLYLNLPADQMAARVNLILKKLGLESCADTRVGNEFAPGLSGGQKRRLSIGVALIKQPKLIILDEPTSGLDAAAAAKIMKFITDIARRENLIIIATIHQPSTSVFNGFDKFMLLSQGRTAFYGTAAQAQEHFEALGHAMPTHTNPADFYLDLINTDFVDPTAVAQILDTWEQKGLCADGDDAKSKPAAATSELHAVVVHKPAPADAAGAESVQLQPSASTGVPRPDSRSSRGHWCQRLGIMLERHAKLAVRDMTLYTGRMAIFFMAGLFFTFVYWDARSRAQDQALNRVWLAIWYLGVPTNMGVVAVWAYNTEYVAIAQEIKNGMISPSLYLTTRFVLELPTMFLFSLFAVGFNAYAVAGFEPSGFLATLLICSAGFWAWESLAQALSPAFRNPLLSMMFFLSAWFNSFLFGGTVIAEEDTVWPFKFFTYIVPLRYIARSMIFAEFKDATYDACSGSDCLVVSATEVSGRSILDALHPFFSLCKNSDRIAHDLGILVLIGTVLKVCYIGLFYYRVHQTATIKPPAKTA